MCYVLTYTYRILNFMYIFGYFFQKGHILRALHKKGHIDKKLFWGWVRGWQTTPPAHSAPKGLDQLLRTLWHGFCLLNEQFYCFLSFNNDTSKNHVNEISRTLHKKALAIRQKIVIF